MTEEEFIKEVEYAADAIAGCGCCSDVDGDAKLIERAKVLWKEINEPTNRP